MPSVVGGAAGLSFVPRSLASLRRTCNTGICVQPVPFGNDTFQFGGRGEQGFGFAPPPSFAPGSSLEFLGFNVEG
jgi:hypothetical protein